MVVRLLRIRLVERRVVEVLTIRYLILILILILVLWSELSAGIVSTQPITNACLLAKTSS